MPRPISIPALTALELAPPDLVSIAAAAGYSHVGLRLVAATTTEPQRAMIGDTPMVPDQADAKIAETSYGAVRAYQHTVGQASPYGTDSADDESFDIRKASPRAQARWLAADESLTY